MVTKVAHFIEYVVTIVLRVVMDGTLGTGNFYPEKNLGICDSQQWSYDYLRAVVSILDN